MLYNSRDFIIEMTGTNGALAVTTPPTRHGQLQELIGRETIGNIQVGGVAELTQPRGDSQERVARKKDACHRT